MPHKVQEIPLPPDDLMVAVAGHANHADFGRSRLSGPAQMLKDLADAGISADKVMDVLDFGCGCGRFLAGWVMLGTSMRLKGCDYNSTLVDWSNQNIPGVTVSQNSLGELLPYAPASFDLIYLLSVFTHLTLAEQRRLVAEFSRTLRPGGYVYVSFHGEYFYPTMFPQLENGEEIFKRTGFLIKNQNQEGSNDCWTLHSVDNLISLFDGFLPVKHFKSIERGPTDVAAWQDTLIFQKK